MAFVIIQHAGNFKQGHLGSLKLILLEIGCQGFVGLVVSIHVKGKIVHLNIFKLNWVAFHLTIKCSVSSLLVSSDELDLVSK